MWALVGLGLIAASVAVFLWQTNELYSFRSVIRAKDDALWGPAFSQFDYEYKLERSKFLQPEILALGSSRANQFRDVMFPGARFYSAAGAAANLEKAERFLKELYVWHRPRVLILTIDPWWLRPVDRLDAAQGDFAPEEYSLAKMVSAAMRHMFDPSILLSVLREQRVGKRDPFSGRRAVGYRAAWHGDGYRPDGSTQYGRILRNADPYFNLHGYGYRNGFRYYIRAVQQQTGRFRYTGPLAATRMARLDAILDLNRRHKITTILVLAPFPEKLYQAIERSDPQRDYFTRFERAIEAAARRHGAEFFEFHNLARLGVDDSQTIDDVHADEFAYLNAVYRMLESGSVLKSIVDRAAVAALLAKVSNAANRPHVNQIAR